METDKDRIKWLNNSSGVLIDNTSKEELIGEEGEKYISEKLKKIGYKIFYPENKYEISDRILLSDKTWKFFLGQFKRKDPLKVYPNFTGVDLYQYKNYKEEQSKTGLPMIMLFVNKKMDKIYGGWLDDLEKYNPMELTMKNGKKIISWDIRKMKDYKKLL